MRDPGIGTEGSCLWGQKAYSPKFAADRYGHLFLPLDEVLAQRIEDTYGEVLAPHTRPKAI